MRTLCSLSLVLALAGAAHAGAKDKRLDIIWVDVEGGAATLIVTPAGESVLIDAGNPGGRDPQRIHKAAREAGVEAIDHLIVTHYHVDHYGGVAELAALMPIRTLYENGLEPAPMREKEHKAIPAYTEAKVGKRVHVKPGDRIPLRRAGGAAAPTLLVLGGHQQFIPAKTKRENPLCAKVEQKSHDITDNANSIVTLLRFGDFDFLDTGDLTWNVEAKLVCPHAIIPEVDVFQSGHHGLDASNNPVLVHTARPRVVVFNNGPRKGGQPGAFATAKASPGLEAIYQVHQNLVSAESNTAPELIANKGESCEGHPVSLHVDPRGASYTVVVPSTGHKAVYKSKRP